MIRIFKHAESFFIANNTLHFIAQTLLRLYSPSLSGIQTQFRIDRRGERAWWCFPPFFTPRRPERKRNNVSVLLSWLEATKKKAKQQLFSGNKEISQFVDYIIVLFAPPLSDDDEGWRLLCLCETEGKQCRNIFHVCHLSFPLCVFPGGGWLFADAIVRSDLMAPNEAW